MLDISLIRKDPDFVKTEIEKRADDPARIDAVLDLDTKRRTLLQELETLRQERNVASKAIGRLIGDLKKAEKSGDDAAVSQLKTDVETAKQRPTEIGDRIATLEDDLRTIDADFRTNMMWIPNLPHESTPVGPDEDHNVIHDPQGAEAPSFDF